MAVCHLQAMVANCVRVATELADRVSSAKKKQANAASLEDQLEQKEELLARVKQGTNAATALEVRKAVCMCLHNFL